MGIVGVLLQDDPWCAPCNSPYDPGVSSLCGLYQRSRLLEVSLQPQPSNPQDHAAALYVGPESVRRSACCCPGASIFNLDTFSFPSLFIMTGTSFVRPFRDHCTCSERKSTSRKKLLTSCTTCHLLVFCQSSAAHQGFHGVSDKHPADHPVNS